MSAVCQTSAPRTNPRTRYVVPMMQLLQQYASAWALVGTALDDGEMLAEAAKIRRNFESYANALAEMAGEAK